MHGRFPTPFTVAHLTTATNPFGELLRHGRKAAVALTLMFAVFSVHGQITDMPTRGKEFWLGFQQNAYGAQTLTVRIAATAATSGTVSMPLTGWSQPFAVGANNVVNVTVPNTAEHAGSEVVTDKSVLVQALDSVTVTAVSFQSFTTDGAQIIPVQGLGIDYLVQAYRGLPGFADFYKSELLIVATADGTQIDITPSVNTSGGHMAGVPFTVNLDAGQTYQVQSALAALDLTGTRVTAAPTSGPCRPFAVYGGSMCANVPVACPACDHLFEQMAPIDTWGTQFFTIPIANATNWSYRITASQNGTSVNINGGAPIALSAGQSHLVSGASAPVCITANLPVSAVQITEGFNCAGSGDPSMIMLTPAGRYTNRVSWNSVVSPQITSHSVGLVVPAAGTGSVTLDGAPVPAGAFTFYGACSNYAHATLNTSAGTHTLVSPVGFIAYAYGGGTGESYAFPVENHAPPVIEPDSVICTSGPLTLTSPVSMVNAIWYEQSAPGTILATGLSYTFTPTQNGTYVVSGELPISGCPLQYDWMVGLPVDPSLALSANGGSSAGVCQFSPVQLNAAPTPDPLWYDIQWSPAALVSDPSIPNPIAYPTQDTWFTFDVVSPVGCGSFTDSVFVTVSPSSVVAVDAQVDDNAICSGEDVQLHTQVELAVAFDALDTGLGTMWNNVQGGTVANSCGSLSGNALYFNGAASRSAQSNPVDVSTGGTVRFALKIANGAAPCDNADPGEDVVLEYSLTGGAPFTLINTYSEASYPTFTSIVAAIPVAAQTAGTTFRWRQLTHSGAGQDNWALDNVTITHFGITGLNFSWTPAPFVSVPANPDPTGTPTSSTWFHVNVNDPLSGCSWSDSVFVDVQPAFNISVNSDTTICASGPVQLHATPSSGSGISYSWTPNNGTLSSLTSDTPIATPTATTIYSVTATTAIGCSDTEDVVITVGQLVSVDVTSTDVDLCPGENATLNAAIVAGGGTTIAWTPNNGTLSSLTNTSPIATPTATTTYTCTVTDNLSSCQLSDTVTVAVHGPYTISVTPSDTICSALGVQLSVTHSVPAPSSIAWSPAANLNSGTIATPTIIADTTTTYVVTVSDAFGCSVTDSTTIAVAFDDILTPVSLTACAGQNVVLNAGYPGSTYEWSTTATTQIINVNTTGSYTVEITDVQLCQAVKTFNVTFNPLPIVNFGPDPLLCGVSSYVLDAGNPGCTYIWNTSATTQTITATVNGPYNVTVTTPLGCSASDAVYLTFNAMPVDVLNDVTTCVSSTPVTLDAGNAGSTYLWNTSATTQTISTATSNTYSVAITTPQNCTATYDAVVNILPVPVVDLGPDTVLCQGETLLLDAGNPGATYLWSTSATSQTITATSTAIYSVTVSNGGCSTSDDIEAVFQAIPTDNLNDVTSCVDDAVILDAGNLGSTYLWSTGATGQTISVTVANTYSVTITNPAGCSATYDAVVNFATYPVFSLGPDTILCDGEVLHLDAGYPGMAHTWSTGASSQSINVTSTGNYSCTVNNGFCSYTDEVHATFNPTPDPLAMHEYYTCLDDEPGYVVIDAGNAGSGFEWSTGEQTQIILAGAYGWYFVQMTNPHDCSLRDSARVIEFCPASIYVPNTFSPNGDGVNDVWLPLGKSIATMELYVFDRWGGILFASDNATIGWDGTANGTQVPNDVYVWRMKYRFQIDEGGQVGEEHEQLGHVTVLR